MFEGAAALPLEGQNDFLLGQAHPQRGALSCATGGEASFLPLP